MGAEGTGARAVPHIFGKFELLERIAVGGMAEIFLARSISLGGISRTCVIKRILPEFSFDKNFVSMFIDEARITIGLEHSNIVRLLDFGQCDGTYYMAMEYVDGFDLVDILRQEKRAGAFIPVDACVFVAREMCRGLHHAHTQKDYRGLPLGIVHRDVSPHNVLVSHLGAVKVADFGIASARHKLTVTQAGTLKGKFAYMAPEQSTGSAIDARADVWAVGVTLYELLTSSRLFASDNPVATIGRVLNAEILPPSSRRKDISRVVDDVACRALTRDLKKRFQSAEEMADALDAALHDAAYGEREFAAFLSMMSWTEETTGTRPRLNDVFAPLPSAVHQRSALMDDPVVRAVIERFRREPDIWLLTEISALHLKRGDEASALNAMRTASAVFSSRALLVQAICAFAPAKRLLSDARFHDETTALAELRGGGADALDEYFVDHDHGGLYDVVKAVDAARNADGDNTSVFHLAPLFSRLSTPDYVRLVEAVDVRTAPVGTVVLKEGETGTSLFAIGRGRAVVSCSPSNDEIEKPHERQTIVDDAKVNTARVNLSALADGDFFGEFSYLTGRPRSASVESITDLVLLEISSKTSEQLLQRDAAFQEPLLEFYKERVGELMMAKNPVFSVLPPEDRRILLAKSELKRYRDQENVVSQGEIQEDMFFIKHGEVEVYRDEDGIPVFINKLREGDFFGEMAAIHGTPRSASVRAMGDIEVFLMRRGDLDEILDSEPRLRHLIELSIERRATEATHRLAELRAVFGGT